MSIDIKMSNILHGSMPDLIPEYWENSHYFLHDAAYSRKYNINAFTLFKLSLWNCFDKQKTPHYHFIFSNSLFSIHLNNQVIH